MSETTRRIVVLISGSGTNLQALIDACENGTIPNAAIALVLSNRKAAFGLERARKHNIDAKIKALQPYLKNNPDKTREDYDEEIARIVLDAKPDLVVFAGWMHVFSQRFLAFMNPNQNESGGIPIINLHPALPGAFDGANAIERAFEAFQKGEITESGVMVHRVTKEVDQGKPVLVKKIDMRSGEAKYDFERRLHTLEWEVIVEATNIVLGKAS